MDNTITPGLFDLPVILTLAFGIWQRSASTPAAASRWLTQALQLPSAQVPAAGDRK